MSPAASTRDTLTAARRRPASSPARRRRPRSGAGRGPSSRRAGTRADGVAEPDVFAAEEIARVDGHDRQRDLAPRLQKPHAVDRPCRRARRSGPAPRWPAHSEDLVAGGGHAATPVGGLALMQPVGGPGEHADDHGGDEEEQRGVEQRAESLDVEREDLEREAGVGEPQRGAVVGVKRPQHGAEQHGQRQDGEQHELRGPGGVVRRRRARARSMNCMM